MANSSSAMLANARGETFVQRQIYIRATKADAELPRIPANLQCSAEISQTGNGCAYTAKVKLLGVSEDTCNMMTADVSTGLKFTDYQVDIYAGTKEFLGWVFSGGVISCFADFDARPNFALNFSLQTASFNGAAIKQDTTVAAGTPMRSAIESILKDAHPHTVVGECPDGSITSQECLTGTVRDRLDQLCYNYRLDRILAANGVMHFVPRNRGLDATAILVTPATGLIGTPNPQINGIDFRCIFNPNITAGRKVSVESRYRRCCGTWLVASVQHHISTLQDSPAWESHVRCVVDTTARR